MPSFKYLRFLLALVLLASLCSATPRQDDPVPVAPVASDPSRISREDAQQRVTELLAQTDGDEAERSRLVDLYRQLILRVDAEEDFTERAEAFRNAIDDAPTEAAKLRDQLAEKEKSPALEPEDEAETSAEVQQLLTHHQAELATLHAQLGESERRIANEESRAAQPPGAEAREALVQIENQLAQLAPLGADAKEGVRVERAVLRARERARSAEVAMLEQEILSRSARLEQMRAQRDLLAWSVAREEARATQLENRIAELRQADAERARQEAERLRSETLNKHRLISETAQDISDGSLEIEELLPSIAAVRERRKAIATELTRVSADFEQTTRSLDLGITGAIGAVLLEQRSRLPRPREFRRAASERSDEVGAARLRLFQLERQLREPTGEEGADKLLGELTAEEAAQLSERDRADLRAELAEILLTKRANWTLLQGTLHDYLSAIIDLETQESALLGKAAELAAVLDERLLWIPNAQPYGVSTLMRLSANVSWLVSRTLVNETVSTASSDLQQLFGVHAFVLLFLVGLIFARRRIQAHLESLYSKVGKVLTDKISLTLAAFALHVLHALPVPGVIVWMGWRLMAAQESTEAAKAVGSGLVASFGLFFTLRLLCDFFDPAGVACAHFRWTERTGNVVRKNLNWYLVVAVPATFVIALTQAQTDRLIRHELGRTAFVVSMLAAAVLAYRLLHHTRGLFVGRAVERASTWLRRSRPLWLPLGIMLPLTLAGIALMGYYYAALQLAYRLNQTVFIILSTLFIHAFLTRWLVVSQRRLALRVARERRAAQAKKSGAGDDALVENTVETFEEIDVVEIKEQTQDLLRISLALLFVAGLWFAWMDVLPALGFLEDVNLWYHEEVVDGVSELTPITLMNLGLALFLVLMTIAAAQNMPGFLEIALLQRLQLEPGVRYATRTLALYTIVGVGIVLAFNSIGVGWSSVQWLLAALTVGLGFGLQEIFANFVSGLIILLERPIRVGDTVTVGEVSGVVSRIRMRATTITDWSRRELVVPNKNFITGELINWSLSDPILRVEFPIGIAYGSDTPLAHKTILQVCRDHPMVLNQPEANVFFVGFGDNSLNFEARVFLNEPTNTGRSRVVHDLHMAVDKACRERDITIAFPQRDLHFKTSDAVLRVAVENAEAFPIGTPWPVEHRADNS